MKKQNKIEKASTYLGTNNEVSGLGSGRPKHYPTALDLPYQSESFFLKDKILSEVFESNF